MGDEEESVGRFGGPNNLDLNFRDRRGAYWKADREESVGRGIRPDLDLDGRDSRGRYYRADKEESVGRFGGPNNLDLNFRDRRGAYWKAENAVGDMYLHSIRGSNNRLDAGRRRNEKEVGAGMYLQSVRGSTNRLNEGAPWYRNSREDYDRQEMELEKAS